MSRFKDEWNERYQERLEELEEQGIRGREAEDAAIKHADGLAEEWADRADYIRKQRREEGL